MALRVNVLGPVTAAVGDAPFDISAPRQRAVLGVLALRRGRTVGIGDLISALWPDEEPPNARKALQTYVARLRKRLPDDAVVSDGDGYRLSADTQVDADVFESLSGDARAAMAAGRHRQAMTLLADALELWRGDVVEEVGGGTWLAGDQLRLAELRLVVEEDRIDASLGAGMHLTVVAEAEKAVVAQPLRERRWAQLMLALYRSGRQAEALQAYQRCRRVLVDELGVEPGIDVRALEQAILEQSPTLVVAPAAETETRIGRSLPPSLLDAARVPMVGRAALRAALQQAWQRVGEDARHTALLVGEPGAGKTRLAAALAEHVVSTGGAVMCGRCQPELIRPFQPFAEALADVEVPTAATRDQYQFFEAVTRALAKVLRLTPVLLVVEDLHWATPETLRMFRYVARAPELRGLFLLGTLRDTEMPMATLGEIQGAEVVSVGPMSLDEVRELLTARDGDPAGAARLHELAGGNPFLVDQLLLEERESHMTSDSVVRRRGFDVIASRIAKLQPATRAVLELAAVTGAEFDLGLLASAHPDGQEHVLDALEEAESAGLVVATAGGRGRFAFRHAVLRSALNDTLPASRRMRLHRAVATALEAEATRDPGRVGALARHYAEAAPLGLGMRAVDYSRRAGEGAIAAHAYGEAADFFTLALEALPFAGAADDALRCDLLTARGGAVRAAGDTRSTDLVEAAALARRLGDPQRLAEVVLAAAGASFLLDAYATNTTLVELAQEAAEALHDRPALRARMLSVLAVQLIPWTEHDDRRLAVLDEALRLARHAGSPDVITTVLISRLAGWSEPYDLDGRVATAREALQMAEQTGNLELIWSALHFLATAQIAHGDIDSYTATRLRVRELAMTLQQPSATATELLAQAADRFLAGDLEGVERLADEAATIAIRGGIPDMMARGISTAAVGPARLLQGRAAELSEEIEFMSAFNARSAWRYCRPLMYLQMGRRDDARADFAELAAAQFTDVPRRVAWGLLMAMAARTAVALDDTLNAGILLDRLRPLTGTVVTYEACHFDLVDKLLGSLSLVVGDADAATDYLHRSAEQSRRLGTPLFLAATQIELARVASLRGDHDGAEALTRVAAATADRLGAHALADEARSVMAGESR